MSEQQLESVFAALSPALCDLSQTEQRLALDLYRELLLGQPVSLAQLGVRTGESVEDLSAQLRRPAIKSLIYRDDQDRIIGFGGLAVVPMKHRFTVDDRTLYTWCAWDALFLVDALDVRAEVESTCPETGTPVRLTLSGAGIERADPAVTVLSFLLPDAPLFEQTAGETMSNFCHYIHFLASPEAAAAWTGRHEGTFALSLDEGFELGRRNNDVRFGAVLDRGGQ